MKVMFALILLGSIGATAFAKNDRFYKPSDKITFTYEEFRKLSPDHQAQWIQELRNFNRNLDLVIDGQRLTAKKPKFWSFLEELNLDIQPANRALCQIANFAVGSSEAWAQDKNCLLRKRVFQGQAQVCVVCTSNGFELLSQCAENNRRNPEVSATEILAKINDKANLGPKLTISQADLASQVDKINKTGYANFSANYVAPNPIFATEASEERERRLALEKTQAKEPSKKTVRVIPTSPDSATAGVENQGAIQAEQPPRKELTPEALKAYAEKVGAGKNARAQLQAEQVVQGGQGEALQKGPRLVRDRPITASDKNKSCQVNRRVVGGLREICMVCPGDAFSGVNVCTAENNNSEKIAKNLIANLSKEEYEGSKVDIDEKSLAEIVAVTKGEAETVSDETRQRLGLKGPLSEGSVAFNAPVQGRQVLTKTISTAGSTSPVTVALPNNTQIDIKDASAPGPLTTIEKRDENNKVVERVGNDPSVANFRRRNLHDLGDRDGNESVDADELFKTDRVACIYAGWAVEDVSKCSPVTEKEILDASGKKVKYSCRTGEQNSDSTIYGENPDGKSLVLCNPVIFGLMEGKPLCIKKAKNATEQCAGLASKSDQALEIAKQNPKEYRALTRRVELLCQADEEKLRAHFVKRGKPEAQINNSIKDLSTTCQHIRTRMAQLMEENNNASPDAGTR